MNKTPFPELNSTIAKIELEELNKGECYPCTIVMDRYDGCYSGGKWLALNEDPDDVPGSIGANDPEEQHFWRDHGENVGEYLKPIGKGADPNEAYADLVTKMKKYWSKLI